MIYPITKFNGLNLRDSLLNRAPEYASGTLNVRLDANRAIVKRNGTDAVVEQTGILDLINYNNDSKLIAVTETELLELNELTMTFDPVINDWDDVTTPLNYTEAVSFCEYNNNLYIADPAGNEEIMKYDGDRLYRCGMPLPSVTSWVSSGGSTPVYLRVFYQYYDINNNSVYGDFETSSPINISTSNTITVNLDLTNVSAVNKKYPTFRPADGSVVALIVAVSTEETFGYHWLELPSVGFRRQYQVDNTAGTAAIVISGTDITNTLSRQQFPLEDFYDTTVLKGIPPKASYISIYNNIMVAAGDNSLPSSDITKYDDRIFWSDLSIGSTVETFAPFATEQIGNTGEGGITGIFPGAEALTVLKNRAVYHISGNLPLKQYRIVDALSSGVGCVSHKSIAKVIGGCVFMSDRGIYAVNGVASPSELSDIIEPYFYGVSDLSGTKTIVDTDRERVYFYIPSVGQIVMYDYYHKEFFIYDSIDCSNGLAYYNNTKYMASVDGLDKFNKTSYNDKGNAIIAEYVTSWLTEGYPSLVKKYVDLFIFSLTDDSSSIDVESFKDWNYENELVSGTIDFGEEPANNLPLTGDNSKAVAFKLSNSAVDENMVVTGISVDVKGRQTEFKGQ